MQSLFVMDPADAHNTHKDRIITFGRIDVVCHEQKDNPNWVRITAGGNLIIYPGDLATKIANLATSKILWNSVLSTKGAIYMWLDIKNVNLCVPTDRYEYMHMPLNVFPWYIIKQYYLNQKQKNGCI